MVEPTPLRYEPDFVTPPGQTLQDTLDGIGMRQAEFAKRTGNSAKTINEIVRGKAPITPDMALRFERVLGVPASFWMNFERSYRESLARAKERALLQKQVQWLKRFPFKKMIQYRWLREFGDTVTQAQELLGFFGVASPDCWNELWIEQPLAAFRQSKAFQSNPEATAAWLRRGEIEGHRIETRPFDEARFRRALVDARRLTLEPPDVFQERLKALCAECGVAVALVRELTGVRMSGATRWLKPDKALIQLSLRYKTDDQLWFSFFHEAGHILLHGKRSVFLDTEDMHGDREEEADAFSRDLLILPKDFDRFAASGEAQRREAIRSFAASIGVAPGVVVGRLQHDGHLPHTHCNGLKVRLEWAQN